MKRFNPLEEYRLWNGLCPKCGLVFSENEPMLVNNPPFVPTSRRCAKCAVRVEYTFKGIPHKIENYRVLG